MLLRRALIASSLALVLAAPSALAQSQAAKTGRGAAAGQDASAYIGERDRFTEYTVAAGVAVAGIIAVVIAAGADDSASAATATATAGNP